ncbi:helix-turn-helix domain-containing protein [Myxacorys almedinensis]|uniref:Helix-turn-helix domain-containing protein n=1 Tax=Myxacorys almedinensis A TaxID=2690445 RepID=A0A8J7Z7P8_9CYAN|nr:AraC family transcriptional regulator [Myxacorys almedinensis]NDJ17923.1 helix-turn-helix domain-containing protein [Myxacorys almedinensis A]
MTIALSSQTCDDLFEETLEQMRYLDPEDEADVIIPFPAELGRGLTRLIDLREEVWLAMDYHEPLAKLAFSCEEFHQPDFLRVGFHLSGIHHSPSVTVCPGEYSLAGSGASHKGVYVTTEGAVREIAFSISIEEMRSFFGQLPAGLQPLIGSPDQLSFIRGYRTTPAMQIALQQMWQCPYHGVMKQRYLETKIWELLLLSVEPLLEESSAPEKLPSKLKSEQVDCIHAARKILLQRLENPPSIAELARLVGLNDRALKEGFRACFGTTTFNYLHHYRLEQAQQMLLAGDLKIEVVMQRVGFTSRSYFAKAFRNKFGMNPGDYARRYRQIL